jgi:hypothetical protein
MKKTVILTLFVLILTGLFVWLLVNRGNLPLSGEKHQTARTIIPLADNENTGTAKSSLDNTTFDESRAQPLIVLDKDETFLQALSVDINKDGTQDQICAIKKNSEPNIYLVPGIQNPQNGDYTRLQAIRTGVTQTRTLLFYSIDIIGDRTNSLVCSGMTAENLQLLAVYIPVTGSDGKLAFSAVADLRSDGSISIQETYRSDAYNLGLTGGDSYPIYTYSSDPDAPDTLNQIERIYRWDKTLKRYELSSQSKIEGKRIESKLMNKLQDGDIGSFENFLGGLWYMTSTSDSKSRYIFFDTAEREIIFHNGATEEIYTREAGSSRRYGTYLTTRNKSISSIRRLIDIELTGIDEIRVKVQEDVKLKIGVDSDWDGVYRKMTANSTAGVAVSASSTVALQKLLDSSPNDWVSSDGQIFRTDANSYTLVQPDSTESGQFALIAVTGKPVIQLRLDNETKSSGKKSRFYLADTAVKGVPGGEQQNMTLTEVSITIDGTTFMGSPPVLFTRKK